MAETLVHSLMPRLLESIGASYPQVVLDLMVVLGSLAVLPWPSVAFSALGAVILNLVIAFNHRPDRYVGW